MQFRIDPRREPGSDPAPSAPEPGDAKTALPTPALAALAPAIFLALAFAALSGRYAEDARSSPADHSPAVFPSAPEARFEYSRAAMGSEARVVLHARDGERARAAAEAAFARIAALERAWGDYDEGSELRRLEREAVPGEWREMGADLALGLIAAARLAAETDGAFDPTVGPLTRLWREARAAGSPPDPAAIRAASERVGLEHIQIEPARSRVRFRRSGIALDLGGIGKGLAADEALLAIEGSGLARALVAIGGDIAAGEPPPGRPGWRIGIGDPDRGVEVEEIVISRAGISTSGDAEQHLIVEGVRLSHILDPARGTPLAGQPRVTVLAPSAAAADAWATAISVRPELAEGLRARGFRVWVRGTARASGE